jgi:hypothetical protein
VPQKYDMDYDWDFAEAIVLVLDSDKENGCQTVHIQEVQNVVVLKLA